MNTISNPVESYTSPTYYQPADPVLLLLAAFLCFFAGCIVASAVAWPFLLLRSPPKVTTHHLIAALSEKTHPIHRHLLEHTQDTVNAAVERAVQAMKDRLDELHERQILNDSVMDGLEKQVEQLSLELSGRRQCAAGRPVKLRKVLSDLQAPMTEGGSSATNDDDNLSAPTIPPPSPPTVPSRSSSPVRHDSDSDSIYGSDSGQPAQTQAEAPEKTQEFDDELAALVGWSELDDASSASERDSDVDAEGETDDGYVPPPVEQTPAAAPATAPASIAQLPGLGNLAKRQIKPLSSMKTKGTRR
ncbi:hypothetical protein T440DRAFT_539892 [Plenodomus tracheiphilus IPT5]|uniref:Uncharacterized protein n=1 Tax=Plenodomus tracheiphilus IPT5 TaxID=1408161 RepID=A0A6A7AY67_9PLEO|nr:hypothetical protein T440DRAFT_539892 [Plenodomus tracheiphilus IPT5]